MAENEKQVGQVVFGMIDREVKEEGSRKEEEFGSKDIEMVVEGNEDGAVGNEGNHM